MIKLLPSGKIINRVFHDDINIYEIYKSNNLEFGLDINNYHILVNGEILDINEKKEDSFLFNHSEIYINEYDTISNKFH